VETSAYDASGNRLSLTRGAGGSISQMSYAYAPLSNLLSEISTNGAASRSLTHDASGNLIEDVRAGYVYRYAYDASNRLSEVTKDGIPSATYLYNGFGQLASRTLTAASATPGTTHYLYDTGGHLIVEADGATGQTLREYLWLDHLPVAVIEGEALYHVVTDHLYRPVAMYDSSGTEVWSAVFEPFGALHSVSGPLTLDLRFPGQFFELESGLHYNWHRHYDPTLGRYTQPDPIGLNGGSNRFAYARSSPLMNIDPDGRFAIALPFAIPVLEAIGGVAVGMVAGAMIDGALDRPQEQPFPPLPQPLPVPKMCLDGTNWNGGGGGGGGKGGDECDQQYEDDSETCRYLSTKKMRAKCWASAMERYADCRAGRTPMPLRY
jgi:RHS repeat-associated protein